MHFITLCNFQGLLRTRLFNLTLYHKEVLLLKCLCKVLGHVAAAPWCACCGEAEEAGAGCPINTLVFEQ